MSRRFWLLCAGTYTTTGAVLFHTGNRPGGIFLLLMALFMLWVYHSRRPRRRAAAPATPPVSQEQERHALDLAKKALDIGPGTGDEPVDDIRRQILDSPVYTDREKRTLLEVMDSVERADRPDKQ